MPLLSPPSPAFWQHVKMLIKVTRSPLCSQMTSVRHDALNSGQVRVLKSLPDVNLGTLTLGGPQQVSIPCASQAALLIPRIQRKKMLNTICLLKIC